MKQGRFYGVGVGPGAVEYLTLRAAAVLRSVDIIFTVAGANTPQSISRKVVTELEGVRAEVRELIFSMSREADIRQAAVRGNAARIAACLQAGKNCAFATLGDPMTYSTFGYVLTEIERQLPAAAIEIVPGITAFAALAARARWVLVENTGELRIKPGFDPESIAQLDFPPDTTTVMMKIYRNRERLLRRLADEADCELLYGARLGLPDEQITTHMETVADLPPEYLSMVLVKKGRSGQDTG